MSVHGPQTQEQLLEAFARQETASVAYWTAFDTATFFRSIGSSWSPAETVRHLNKSTRPVVKALAMPKIALRLLFGWPRRASMTYDAFRDRYRQALSEGGQAGRFAPSGRAEDDAEAWGRKIMEDFMRVNGELCKAIARWPDRKLDRFQLPHPLLGKVTVREMLFFTHYHQQHHMDVVQRHLTETRT